MDPPITDLMHEQACYDQLVGWLHPDGMTCPRRVNTIDHPSPGIPS